MTDGDALKRDVYPLLGVIERFDRRTLARRLIPFSPQEVASGQANRALADGDRVRLLSAAEVRSLTGPPEEAKPANQPPDAEPPLPADIAALAADGFGLFISHRPDGEAPGQPTHEALRAAAETAGARFIALPCRGMPGPDAVEATRQALAEAGDTKALMFCAAGMRSAAAWAMASVADGASPDAVRAAAAGAGYDLSRLPL